MSPCETCGSWSHPLFRNCPSCGSGKPVDGLWEAVWSEGEHRQELVDYGQRQLADVVAPVTKAITQTKYRYLGGLQAHPSPCDVALGLDAGTPALLVYVPGSKVSMVAIRPDQLLLTSPFAQDVPILNGMYGLGFGNVWAFGRPTVRGGGLVLSYVAARQVRTLAIGNRTGFLSAGVPHRHYRGLAMMLGVFAYDGALARGASIGGGEYAYELGLQADAPAGPVEEVDAGESLRQLDSLRSQGLISEDEYSAKRAEVLRRI